MWFERIDRAAEELLFKTIGSLRIPAGDCATSALATDAWALDGLEIGQVACFVTAGHAHLDWTYAADRVVVMAEGSTDDRAALLRWWRAAAVAIGQPASGARRSGIASTVTPVGPSPATHVPPSNGVIAYSRAGNVQASLFTIDPVTRVNRRLTTSPGIDVRPAWAPDGRSVAFERHSGTRDDPAHIGVVTPGGKTRILPVDTAEVAAGLWQSDSSPAWSPDGRTIVLERGFVQPASEGTAIEIYVMRPDGGEQRRLTDTSIGTGGDGFVDRNTDPTFTPDGRIGYVHSAFSGTCGTVLETDLEAVDQWIAADYSCETGVSFERGISPSDPRWSPDGRSVAFVERSRQQGTFVNVVVDVGPPRRIVTDQAVAGPPGKAASARWSPDGSWLLFNVQGLGIHVVAPDGTGLRALVGGDAGASVEGEPIWSADGRSVAYAARVDGQTDLFVVDVGSGAITRLTMPWRTRPSQPGSRSFPS